MICGVLTALYSNWLSFGLTVIPWLHHLDTRLEFHLQIDVENFLSYLDLGC